MVRIQKSSRYLAVEAEAYTLRHDADRPWTISLATHAGVAVAELFVGAGIDGGDRPERLRGLAPPVVDHDGEIATVVFEGSSDRWAAKRYRFECANERLTYRAQVDGAGQVGAVHLLRGLLAEDAARLGLAESRFRAPYRRPFEDTARGSVAAFRTIWSPRPCAAERELVPAWDSVVIDLVDDPARDGGLDSFLPAPAAVAAELADGSWCGFGLAAPPAERAFSSFAYRGGETFGFELRYEPAIQVNGSWTAPPLEIVFGARDPLVSLRALISQQAQRHEVSHWYATLDPAWREPVLDASAMDQPACLRALEQFASRGLDVGAVWFGPAGDVLHSTIQRCHEAGRRAVLTWPLFGGQDVEAVLGADGLDADGLRIVDVRRPGGGIAAVHTALTELRTTMKAIKPGSLLIAPTVSPWFADVVDMVPLGGLWTDRASVAGMVRSRAELARLASPVWLLAVGDWHCPSRAAWRELVALQPRLGVPVISATEGLDEGDWAALREAWKGWTP